jgi:hypothetical protein
VFGYPLSGRLTPSAVVSVLEMMQGRELCAQGYRLHYSQLVFQALAFFVHLGPLVVGEGDKHLGAFFFVVPAHKVDGKINVTACAVLVAEHQGYGRIWRHILQGGDKFGCGHGGSCVVPVGLAAG